MAVSSTFRLDAQQGSNRSKWLNWLVRWLFAIALAMGGWYVLSSGYMLAKAHLSIWLISDAWALTLKDGQPHPPWSWADTHPVAKIKMPRLGESSYILADANGRNLAFGPAHLRGSGMPGEGKTIVFSGHNDSHFSYLGEVAMGDVIAVETVQGVYRYRVTSLQVVDSAQQALNIDSVETLVLTTCYPFNSLSSGGSLRFQVKASPAF